MSPPPDEGLSQHVMEVHLVLPNSALLRHPTHVELLTFWPHPADPGRSRMDMRLIVPRVEDSGIAPERWTHVWDKNWQILLAAVRDEDLPLLRGSQAEMLSVDAGCMVLGRNEVANQIFHRELRRILSS